MKTINIKGKEYTQVHERLKYFRENPKYKGWSIDTEIIDRSDNTITMKAYVRNQDGVLIGSGTAEEEKGSTYINKTSYVENCETSAWGRALGCIGIGLDTSVASAEEVINAVNNQDKPKVTMKKQKIDDLEGVLRQILEYHKAGRNLEEIYESLQKRFIITSVELKKIKKQVDAKIK
ncbi:MAG: hypothetical protein CMD25_08380 [Flavobacteriales bacterium]|mgnify:FL=1|nr:hypothetical protein [Flavobacteriales bacterium]|tara:strand:+ start:1676 stop:2206 length:531 start_codon:yes stop_codon:yes gene_type:complete